MLVRERDGQNAVLEAVVVKDIRIARRQNRTKAIIENRPGSVFAARSASEIRARQQNRCILIARIIQHEIRIGIFTAVITPVVKKHAAITFAREKFQKLLWHHLIGVNVHAIERRDQPTMLLERLHFLSALRNLSAHWVFQFSRPRARATRRRPNPSICGYRRSVLRSPLQQPSADLPDAYARPCPAGLRNCDSTYSRSARHSAVHRRSCRCTCCNPRRAT